MKPITGSDDSTNSTKRSQVYEDLTQRLTMTTVTATVKHPKVMLARTVP